MAAGLCACVIYAGNELLQLEPWALILTLVLAVSMLLVLLAIGRQPRARVDLSFKVPLVPVVPALSVVINLYLMLELDAHTWIRFSVWMLAGFLIYFLYGVRQSEEGRRRREEAAVTRAVLGQSNPAFTDDTKSFYYTTKF
ncbi:hypothetical protein B566_EDAN001660 [Ephemera danica]|nr:hypothetical protein B566_EDAN001660 [Ephemera danica]